MSEYSTPEPSRPRESRPPIIGVPEANESAPPRRTPGPRKTGILGYVFLFLLVGIAFAPLFLSPLSWTDYDSVVRSSYTEMESWTEAWSLDSIQTNDPLSISSYFWEQALPGPQGLVQRGINLCLHLIAAILLLKIVERLKFPAPLSVALVFALHPATVQTLFWPGYRAELIGLICILGALFFAVGDGSRRNWTAFLLVGVAAILVHPAALALPLIVAAIIVYRSRHLTLEAFNPVLPILFLSLFLALWIEPATPNFPEALDPSQRLYLFGQSMYFYIRQSLFPLTLDLFYPLKQSPTQQHSGAMSLLPFLLFIPFFVLFFFNIRHRWSRALILGLSSYLILVIYGLAQSGRYINGALAHEDHSLYVALPAIVTLIVSGICGAAAHGGQSVVVLWRICLGVITFALLSITTSYTYELSDSTRMWQRMSEVWPNSWQAKAAYVESINDSGGEELTVDARIGILSQILEENPDLHNQRIELARLYRDAGQNSNALREYRRVLRDSQPERAFMEESIVFFERMGLNWEANNVRQRMSEM